MTQTIDNACGYEILIASKSSISGALFWRPILGRNLLFSMIFVGNNGAQTYLSQDFYSEADERRAQQAAPLQELVLLRKFRLLEISKKFLGGLKGEAEGGAAVVVGLFGGCGIEIDYLERAAEALLGDVNDVVALAGEAYG
jgi:hypothetical protein